MSEAKILHIKDLLELVKNEQVELPNVQRGFVWKPSQVENLWDSLLRGFPSGAIITSKSGESSYQLLDGQQRVTSISLGFADVLGNKTKVLRSSTSDIRIFVDLRKPDRDKEGKAYAFRVITRSHPWGYQHSDNTKPLDAPNRAKALELWGKIDPFEYGMLETAYPWDAVAPLPLNIFTKAAHRDADLEELMKELFDWVNGVVNNGGSESNITSWLEDHKSKNGGKPSRNYETYAVSEVYEKFKAMVLNYTIPMQPLPKDILEDDGTTSVVDITSAADETTNDVAEAKDYADEIEEVFVRLNSAGTPLGGEELNYSIIKAKVGTSLQNRIEEKCKGIMKPARFITIAFRLYQQELYQQGIGNDSHNLRIKPKQFQREMREFKKFANFIDEKLLDGGLLEKVKSVLKYGEVMNGFGEHKADYRLPYPLFIKVASTSQGEVMFILMYRLLFGDAKNPDAFKYGSPEHRKMVGIILMFMWNGKDARSRHNKLLDKIWEKGVKGLSLERMWSSELVTLAVGESELKPIPKDLGFLNEVLPNKVNVGTKIWERKEYWNSRYMHFIDHVMCSKDLLLWVQRNFLSTPQYFREELFRHDDTDVPFDWDHISPHNLVKGKQHIPRPLKDIYQQPGNLRAWPYQLNRADQDSVPSDKFPKNADNYYLASSFCTDDWQKFKNDWLMGAKIRDERWRDVYNLIVNRWKDMFSQLRKELLLNQLYVNPGQGPDA